MNVGMIDTLTVNIDKPMKMDTAVIQNKKINIMVGANATGKTLILKMHWAIGTIMGMAVAIEKAGMFPMPKRAMKANTAKNGTPPDLEEMAQFVFDNTFTDQDFNGTLITEYERGKIEIQLKDGKVAYVGTVIDGGVDSVTPVVFMSSELRLFNSMNKLIRLQAKFENADEVLEFYRLYDIYYVEMMKAKVGEGIKIPKEVKEALKDMDVKPDIDTIKLNESGFYYVDSKGVEGNLEAMSNGEQAVVNMFLGARL